MRAALLRISALITVIAALLPLTAQPAAAPESADLAIVNAHVLTMDAARTVHERGAVIVRGEKIVAVGPAELVQRYAAKKTIDARGGLVLPGMVNAHTHVSMTIFRGLGDDVPDRLRRFIFPLEKNFVNRDVVYWGGLHGILEMIEGGVTTFANMYYFEDEVARAVKLAGLRAVLGQTIIDFPAPDSPVPYGGLELAKKFIAAHRGDPLITPAFSPHSPYTVDAEHLKKIAVASAELDAPVLIHLAEMMREEVTMLREKHNATPVEYLDRLGLLNRRLIAAHCIFVTPSDIELLKARDVGVAHAVVANIKSAKGVAPALEMFNRGLRVGLATDGPMSGNTIDIIGQLGYVAKLHKLDRKDRNVMPAADVVEMATRGGARALHLEDRIGSLEPGKLADIIIVDTDSTAMIPLFDPYSALVYAASPRDVRTTIVHGRILMEDRRLLTLDAAAIKARMRTLTAEINAAIAKGFK
jgi:cytosine/adenosine deaminase-related metal-dependent hydrolase